MASRVELQESLAHAHFGAMPHRAIIVLLMALPLALGAQVQPEVISGRVSNDSGKAVAGATVTITRGPDRLVLRDTTDSLGLYLVRFDEGTGDYLVHVAATGLRAARRRVQRQGTERELVANFTLAVDVAALATVRVTASRPQRASNRVDPMDPEPGSPERWSEGVHGQVPPTLLGDFAAIAGTLPNVTLTPGGPSILGSGAESNLGTLNGMAFGAASVPRAARTETRVTGATYDAARGGFAGANIDVRLGPGSRTFQQRSAFVTLDPPALQYADRTTRALGATPGGTQASLGAEGELVRRALTYNVALELARSASDPPSLLEADADALLRAGASPDSVARVLALALPLGLVTAPNLPADHRRDGVTWLGRIDDTRDTLNTRALTTYVGYTREGALGVGPLVAPSTAGERTERTRGMQVILGTFLGPGRRVLVENRLSANQVSATRSPYRAMPGASVLVRSAGTDATREVTGLTLGGGSAMASDDERWTVESGNEVYWNAQGRRHRFKALLAARADGMRQSGGSNALGTYSFRSADDFEANRPASFTRTLVQPVRDGRVWNAAAAFSHNFGPSRHVGLLYGVRVEASGFLRAPAANVALEQALGVRTGAAPTRVHVSPRIGFTFTYNRNRDNGAGYSVNNVGRFNRPMSGAIRGGIGEFRDLLRPGLLADARAATGLPGGTLMLSCVGVAVPAPDWTTFAADATTIPSQCATGGGVLEERAPAATLIHPDYDVPRSWRASVDWNTSIRKWMFRVGALGSYDLSQPGLVDANFAGTPRMTLASEGNRPVYVSMAAIDTASGAVSAAESRRSSQFGRVGMRVSDLRGYGGQLTFGIAPDPMRFRARWQLFASAGYTLQATRRQYRGFDGAAFGDPRLVEWAPAQNDARHIVVLSGGFSRAKFGTLTLFSRLQSGLPFTPVVQGDANGDGRFMDRAFVPDPDTETDATLATQLRALLTTGSPVARRCLSAQLGAVVPRNGCRGPWTQTLNAQWLPSLPRRWGRRLRPSVYFENVLAGVDQLVNGSSPRGWGSPTAPDPVLLVPRGFDAAAQRFRYDVNARFADTRGTRTLWRAPFRLVIDFALDLSTDYDVQQLRLAVEPVRAPGGKGWMRRDADSLTAFYLRRTSSIHKLLLGESDSLFLSTGQIMALRRADSVYSERVRAVYRPVGEFLARGGGAAGKAELDSVKKAQEEYWKIFWEQPEIADAIITPSQRELIPMLVSMLRVLPENRKGSRYYFGRNVTLVDR